MPITAFYDNTLTLHCARCGGAQEVPLDLLVVGILREATVEPLTIALPPCPACNGQEFLFHPQEYAHPHPGSYGHLHRLLVIALYDRLVALGKVQDGVTTLPPLDPAVLADWFPEGLVLPMSTGEEAG